MEQESAMQSDVMEHYGFAKDFKLAGYFETEHHRAVFKEIKAAIQSGRIITLSGIVGCGKTKTLQRLQQELISEKQVLVSRSFSIEKARVNIGTLTTAMFLDLVKDKDFKAPNDTERRDRTLRDVICKSQRPVALFIDEAHDLHPKTLVQLKRLVELVEASGGLLSVVLAGHPKLKNDLGRAAMEEIGSRTTRIQLEGIKGQQRNYIEWLLAECRIPKAKLAGQLTEDALQYLSERLATPLQIEYYLGRAFEEGYLMGQTPVTQEIVESVLAPDLDELEAKLTRQGYSVKVLSELLNVKHAEIRSFMHGQLPTGRSEELRDQLLAIGLPL
jgi:type II secretory pathway predicted ATPase ExeA